MIRQDQHHRPEEDACDAAAAWHVRLSCDDASEADWLSFEAWLAQSPENTRAYERVEALWAELAEVQLPPTGAKVADADWGVEAPRRTPAPAAGRSRVAARGRRERPRHIRRSAAVSSAAVAASLALVVGLGLAPHAPTRPVVYTTAKGERRQVALADGTVLRLNSGSRVSVRLGRTERRVELAEGEVAFDVAHDAARPFMVEAGDRTIRDVGTSFDVLRHAGRLDVAVRRGVVEVRSRADEPPVRLIEGQGISRREGAAGPDRVRKVDAAAVLAWTEGRVVYRDTPLAEVAADLNRYVSTPIEVAPQARDLRLTAAFPLGHEDAMVAALAAFLPVTPVRQAGAVKLELRQARR